MKWTLQKYLDSHNLTAYRLRKESGLSSNTVYPIARGEAKAVNLDTLRAIIAALRKLTGKQVSVCDLLEYRD